MRDESRADIQSQRLIWAAFAVMAAVMTVIVVGMFWSCSYQVAAFNRGIEVAVSTKDFAAITTFGTGIALAYSKTFSILISFLLIFSGTIYVLLPIKASYKASGDTNSNKGSLETNSPGLVIITLGVVLAAVAVMHPISLEYKSTVTTIPAPQASTDVKTSPDAGFTHFDPKEKTK